MVSCSINIFLNAQRDPVVRSTLNITLSFSLMILDLVGITTLLSVHLKNFESFNLFHNFFLATVFFIALS